MVTKQYIVVETPFCRVERVKVKLHCLLIGTCISAERDSEILNVKFYMYMHLLFYLNKLKIPITLYGFSAVLENNLKCFLSIIKPQILLQRIRQLYQVRNIEIWIAIPFIFRIKPFITSFQFINTLHLLNNCKHNLGEYFLSKLFYLIKMLQISLKTFYSHLL